MKILLFSLLCLVITRTATIASDFHHVGDYLLQAHFKVTGGEMISIPMKSMAFRVYSDGITIRVHLEGEEEAYSSFEVYRSDGIGRQRSDSGALEMIPGIQASTNSRGTLKHLRLSKESLTITSFPGVSDQTIVSYAIAAVPKEPEPSE